MGGGIRTLAFPLLPAVQQRLSLAFGLELIQEEISRTHSVVVGSSGPTGEAVTKPFDLSFVLSSERPGGSEPGVYHFVYNMENVTFPAEGDYLFTITIDAEFKHDLPLRVIRTGGPPSPEMEAMALLADGYAAFGKGDLQRAEDIFWDMVARFPAASHGANNLGFVLLARGKADEALGHFGRASELKYDKPEIHDANVGSALYMLDRKDEALVVFQRCAMANPFSGPATLFGVGERGLFVAQPKSASDYVSLMSLNAAWTARNTGDDRLAKRYLVSAGLSGMYRPGDPSDAFSDSVHALRSRLGGSQGDVGPAG
jgi:hypothetical protein